MNEIVHEKNIAGKNITLRSGIMAGLADGSATVRCGDTIVLVTAVASDEPREGIDFFPLTIDIEEKMYAAGKIPGGYFKREGRPSEKSILSARLVDRPLRPNFEEGFRNDVQIIATILSADQENPPDIMAINGASTALLLSDIPFKGPIGAVRVGKIVDEWIMNPTLQELEVSKLDLVVAASEKAVIMVEAGAEELTEKEMIEAINVAHEGIKQIIELQKEFVQLYKENISEEERIKREFQYYSIDEDIFNEVENIANEQIKKAIRFKDKKQRHGEMDKAEELVNDHFQEIDEDIQIQIKDAVNKIKKREVRNMILNENQRIDGRKPDEIREISCDVGLLPRTHGTGLFTRGQTQVLAILTLGTVGEEQRLDDLGIEESKRFLHHYNFPPFSTGEVWPLRGPRRREIGHGALAERALEPLIPDEIEFPYTIRLVSEVLSSNGSTSMASVCSSSLALMDAGVKLKGEKHIGGVAMGLIKEDDKYEILTDILGVEDALGDMDFKVAGTKDGITALQMDLKIEGVDTELLTTALERARQARLFIIDKMSEAIDSPRTYLSEFAPRIISMQIDTEKIRDVIGPGGKTIRKIIDEYDVKIDIEDDGTVLVASSDEESGEKARAYIELLTKDPEVGAEYVGRVTRIMKFGAFVEILPGKEGLVHISKLSRGHVDKVEDVVRVGENIVVKLIEIDNMGRLNLVASNLGGNENYSNETRSKRYKRR